MSTSHSSRSGALAGISAMLGTLVVLQFVAVFIGSRAFIESLADGILLIIPVDVFSWLKTNLGAQAKTWLYVGIVLAMLAIGSFIGWLCSRSANRWRLRVSQASAGLFVFALALLYGVDSRQITDNFLSTTITLAAGALAFGSLLWSLLNIEEHGTAESLGRRRAIGVISATIGGLVLGTNIWLLHQRQARSSIATAESEPTSAITPNDRFYQISKNFTDPWNEGGPDWSININGDVDEERSWSRAELMALGEQHTITTQLCISNEVGGDLIGTAEWTGVPLATVLSAVGASADYVRFAGADDYETTVPMERCTQAQAWLVWGMNGEPLPEAHGAPVRAIIPGLYGMKSVKWLTGMTPTSANRLGYWESVGWTNEAVVKPMSRIDFPRRTSTLYPGTVPVRGIAFGGDHVLQTVEVSTDDGNSWSDATITEQPNPEGIAWSLWQFDWPAEAGAHTLVVRMVDTDGNVQSDDHASPLPDGSSGWHRVAVVVNRQ